MNRIEDIEKKHLETILAGKKITEFYPGDTVKVNVRIVEGKRGVTKLGLVRDSFGRKPISGGMLT